MATRRPLAVTNGTPAEIPSGDQLPGDLIAPPWMANTYYSPYSLAWQNGALYRAKTGFTSGASFSTTNWDQVGGATGSGIDYVMMAPRESYGVAGGPGLNVYGVRVVGTYPGTSNAAYANTVLIPDNWTTYAVDLWWTTNVANPTGNVAWRLDGPVTENPGNLVSVAIPVGQIQPTPVPAQWTITVTTLATNLTVSGKLATIRLYRFGADASNTFTGEVGVFGINLRKLT